ncbi:MAG: sugar ABC transporter substrate-binding protein [Eubacteriales bacterium]|nr:sugar ABC transporter substrate-binding protein [Eubacteriales bacterium]
MRKKKLAAALLAAGMVVASVTGCGGGDTATTGGDESAKGSTDEKKDDAGSGEVTEFTMFISSPGSEINSDNEIANIIAEKTGVKVKETFLTGQTAEEAVGTYIASGDYTDYINGGDGMVKLYEAGALIPWDDYIDKYPNIKEFLTPEEWDMFRQDDGKIYWLNPFDNSYGEDKTTTHGGEAFWIQTRVLKWAGYPEIKTLDQYFDLLEKYNEANPTMEDGATTNIPYTILCEDWRYFCLENAPQFLDGYPNDGSCMVDKETLTVMDYNTSDTAKKYFNKLNEEYKKGIVDPESFTQTYDEYIAKLSTGRVLGMVDQWWDFAYTINDILKTQGLDKQGCNYVPMGLVIDEGMENRWYTAGDTVNVSSGIGITVNCKDPDKAFKFIDDCLSQEIHDLRFWGVEGVDYLVDDEGLFYRTEDIRMQVADTDYKASHMCSYSNFPQYGGTSRDGKNAMTPAQQPTEFFDSLTDDLKECFEAYGCQTYIDFLNSDSERPGEWFPMWSFSNSFSTATPGGTAWTKIGEIKHEYLPKVCMADDFESAWTEYMGVYDSCNPQDYLGELQEELNRRVGK